MMNNENFNNQDISTDDCFIVVTSNEEASRHEALSSSLDGLETTRNDNNAFESNLNNEESYIDDDEELENNQLYDLDDDTNQKTIIPINSSNLQYN